MLWKLTSENLELTWAVLLKWYMYLNDTDHWSRHEIYRLIVFLCNHMSKVSLGILCTSLLALFICNCEIDYLHPALVKKILECLCSKKMAIRPEEGKKPWPRLTLGSLVQCIPCICQWFQIWERWSSIRTLIEGPI